MAQNDAVYALYKNTYKTSVPRLIDSIDKNEQGLVGNLPATENNVTRYESFVGVIWARVIENILSNGSEWGTYKWGMIFKRGQNQSVDNKPSLDDMRAIKHIYEEWWEKSRTKSLATLQQEWDMNKRPLTGTRYAWR